MALLTMSALIGYAMLNIATYAAFEHDKRQAIERLRRVRESDLLALAYCGGALGAILGQQLLRHKTRKEPFRSTLYAAGAFNLAICVMLVAFLLF